MSMAHRVQVRVAVTAVGMGKTVITVQDLARRGPERDTAAVRLVVAAKAFPRYICCSTELRARHALVVEALQWCCAMADSKWVMVDGNRAGQAAGSRQPIGVSLGNLSEVVDFLQSVRRVAGHKGLSGSLFQIAPNDGAGAVAP